jgi:hypothetical protein
MTTIALTERDFAAEQKERAAILAPTKLHPLAPNWKKKGVVEVDAKAAFTSPLDAPTPGFGLSLFFHANFLNFSLLSINFII